MDSFQVVQGSAINIDVVLEDSAGVVINASYPGGGFDGTQSLSTVCWPGGDRPISLVAATSWDSAAAGKITITLTPAQTASLIPGEYQIETTLIDVLTPVVCYIATLNVLPGPGGLPLPPTSDRITRIPVETELVDRNAALLLLVGKSTMADGANPAMTGPIGFALQALDITPAIPGVVTDADLAKLDPKQYFLLCDLAGYLLLRNCLNGFAQPDQTASGAKTQYNVMMRRFKAQLDALEKQYEAYLGKYRSMLSVGSIALAPPPRDRWNRYRLGTDFRGSDY